MPISDLRTTSTAVTVTFPALVRFARTIPLATSSSRTIVARMIEFGHLTHVGLRREFNEDTYYGDSELGLWLVADGMGGHEYGEVASALARESIVREVRGGDSAGGRHPYRRRGNHPLLQAPRRQPADGHHGGRRARSRATASRSPGSATAAYTCGATAR